MLIIIALGLARRRLAADFLSGEGNHRLRLLAMAEDFHGLGEISGQLLGGEASGGHDERQNTRRLEEDGEAADKSIEPAARLGMKNQYEAAQQEREENHHNRHVVLAFVVNQLRHDDADED